MTEEDYEREVADLQLAHEELEQENHSLAALSFFFITWIQWHSWLISISLALALYAYLRKFLAKKLFSNGIKNLP